MKLYLIVATTTRAVVRAPHPTGAAVAAGLGSARNAFPPHQCIEIDLEHLDALPSQNKMLPDCIVKENPHS